MKITDDCIVHRYWCSCGALDHALEISVNHEEGQEVMVDISTRYTGQSVGDKVHLIWRLLRGHQVIDHEIILRNEDIPQIATILGELCALDVHIP